MHEKIEVYSFEENFSIALLYPFFLIKKDRSFDITQDKNQARTNQGLRYMPSAARSCTPTRSNEMVLRETEKNVLTINCFYLPIVETDEQIFDLVEQYLAGSMSAQEREAFESRRETDPAFAEEVLEHLRARAAIRAAGRERLKDNFEAVYEAQMSKQFRSMLWRVAAGIAALIMAGILIWQFLPQQSFSPQELYGPTCELSFSAGCAGAGAL